MKRFACVTMIIILMFSVTIFADAEEIQFGTDVYNLVTTFVGDAGTSRGFAWSSEIEYTDMAVRYAPKGEWNNAITENAVYTDFENGIGYIIEHKEHI